MSSGDGRVRRVAVIGAGPAGCAAAIGLAERGYRVTVFEGKEFPRTKVCGEYISPAATGELESLLGVERLERAGARRVGRYVLQIGAKERAWGTPGEAWALSRRTLDTLLVERARASGATVCQPMRVCGVEYEPDGVRVLLSDESTHEADLVIHADGLGRHDPAGSTRMIEGVIGHKCHLRLPLEVLGPGAIGMRAGPGAYVGIITVEGGLSTVALVAREAHIARFGGDADTMLKSLWGLYDPAWREGPWVSCGVARNGYIEAGHARSVRIGNAAGAVDPVGGEGIGLGLWAGVQFSMLLGTGADGVRLERVKREFGTAYKKRLRWRRVACRFGAEVLMRPGMVRVMWPLLGVAPGLTLGPWYRMTGKPV